jgi:hypothetical protein
MVPQQTQLTSAIAEKGYVTSIHPAVLFPIIFPSSLPLAWFHLSSNLTTLYTNR